MTSYQKDKIYIPTEWTGEQAKAVWELLDDIGSAIWDVHEKGILKAMHIENSMLKRAARGDNDHELIEKDDLPF